MGCYGDFCMCCDYVLNLLCALFTCYHSLRLPAYARSFYPGCSYRFYVPENGSKAFSVVH